MVEQTSSSNAVPKATPFQFSLRQLLGTFVILGIILAAITWSVTGIDGACILFVVGVTGLIVGMVRQSRAVILTCVGVGLIALFPIFNDSRVPGRRAYCMNNLMQIGNALHHYHVIHGGLPPAYVADENGKSIHSWRAIILPNLSEQQLADQYDFSEPWDGPSNSQLGKFMPRNYGCPSDRAAFGSGFTNYVAIVGPGTAWPGDKGARLSDIDDPSQTILVVEVVGANISWTEPRDLNISDILPEINGKRATGISSRHPKGANVLMADGKVVFLSNDLLAEKLQAMLTPAGRK